MGSLQINGWKWVPTHFGRCWMPIAYPTPRMPAAIAWKPTSTDGLTDSIAKPKIVIRPLWQRALAREGTAAGATPEPHSVMSTVTWPALSLSMRETTWHAPSRKHGTKSRQNTPTTWNRRYNFYMQFKKRFTETT